jgi:hypothetical protein
MTETKVRTPDGIGNGIKLRLAGSTGDLYVAVDIADDRTCERLTDNAVCNAYLSTEVQTETIDGD